MVFRITFKKVKRCADITLAAIGLVVLSPILVLVGLSIFIFDFHSPFFIQSRVGKNKRMFRIIKFRTMLNGQTTFLGKWFRKTGIDELPQMLNILVGQMSFVGPRPLTPEDVEHLGWNTPYHNIRWKLKPGIVGLAQLSPVCHKQMSWFLDRYYIRQRSFLLDLRIITYSCLIPVVGKRQMKKWLHNK